MKRPVWICTLTVVLVVTACGGGDEPLPTPDLPAAEFLRDVILATQRDHKLHVFDASTLEPLGRFEVGPMAHNVIARPDGRMLFLEQAIPGDSNLCCALFALDLETTVLCHVNEPAVTPPTLTLDGGLVFTQRGNMGVEIFDAETLTRLPTIEAPSLYQLRSSPDNNWLFGTGGESLDVFDLSERTMVAQLPTPEGLHVQGDWIGDRFYLFGNDGREGFVWTVTPEMGELGLPDTTLLPPLSSERGAVFQMVVRAGTRLLVYEAFGGKLDRRRRNPDRDTIPGGALLVDPETGAWDHLASSTYFSRIVPSPDGRWLYGTDSVDPNREGPVQLIRMDAATGEFAVQRPLADDTWFISHARLPEQLIPRGEVVPVPCVAAGG